MDTWAILACAAFVSEKTQNEALFRVFANLPGNSYSPMDTVANTLTILMNGQKVGKKRVAVPYARFTESLLEFLKAQTLIGDFRLQESPKSKLVVSLAYDEDGTPKIGGARRISKSGRRVYVGAKRMPYTQQEVGMIIVSTSEGLMDEKHARGKGIGGELICAIW